MLRILREFLRKLAYQIRVSIERSRGIEVASSCKIALSAKLERGVHHSRSGHISIGAGCEISTGVILGGWGGSICLGRNVFIGPYTVIYGHGGVVIGEDTLVAEHCSIHSANHSLPPPERHIRWEPDIREQTKIGKDVWIGAGVRILAGVTIGDGCVIGAGAVVTNHLEPYTIAVGIPARAVSRREASLTDSSSANSQQ